MRELGELTFPEVPSGPTLVVPLGSTEQHGPHLPLDTDTRIAAAVAAEVARRLGHLLAPAMPYGAAGEHRGFAGTISIGTEVLRTVLVEYGRSVSDWADRVVFVNGHGGNLEALRAAVGLLRAEGREAAWVGTGTPGGDAHAGHTETSLLLHLSPELVRSRDGVTGNAAPLAELLPALRVGGVSAVSPSGVLGDPGSADAAAGRSYLAAVVADCAARLSRWQPGADGLLA